MKRYSGRDFNEDEIKMIRQLISDNFTASRRRVSELVCEKINWRKPNGSLKDMSCRVALSTVEWIYWSLSLLGLQKITGRTTEIYCCLRLRHYCCTGFGASAWKTAPRDKFIGWTDEQRRKNLHLIVNNARFLILPWIQSKNLASKTLAMIARRLPSDWMQQYDLVPLKGTASWTGKTRQGFLKRTSGFFLCTGSLSRNCVRCDSS